MPYIKKLVMHGFKSFVRKTEIPFDKGINVILGPNGSGKSNISDALCFVLGRLGVKSMRAARAKNLIFLGTKDIAPAKEATVELVFDNSDKAFSVDKDEISIKRIVRKNGQSIYKINNETKTRQGVLFLLSQAGIDPNGFNIILQGQIQNFARMRTEDRRKIIEEVSGISVYEIRKEKSLKELEKTDEKLKQVMTILQERTNYLNNLEKERQQALRFKKLERAVKRYKASIINSDLERKKKEIEKIDGEISNKRKHTEKIKKSVFDIHNLIDSIQSKINSINSIIQKSAGFEQEQLNKEISDIRAELAGLRIKMENYNERLTEISAQKEEINNKLLEEQAEIQEMQKESPLLNKEKDLAVKKKKFEELEKQRKKFYMIKSELKSIKERLNDKNNSRQNYKSEVTSLIKQADFITSGLFDKKTTSEKLNKLNIHLKNQESEIKKTTSEELEIIKFLHALENETKKINNVKTHISNFEVCPLCKNKITTEHISAINSETDKELESINKKLHDSQGKIKNIAGKKILLEENIKELNKEISKRELDIIKIANIDEKKNEIKYVQEKINSLENEISFLEKRKKELESYVDKNINLEHRYEIARIELQEISLRNQKNVDSEVLLKQRELERSRILLKQWLNNEEELTEELSFVEKDIEEKESLLEEKKEKEQELSRKFEKMISDKNELQNSIHSHEKEITQKQFTMQNIEEEINNLKIQRAEVGAKCENFETEMLDFIDIPKNELIKANRDSLLQKLNKTQEILKKIGAINLRSLEVYDSVKKEYDLVKEKSDVITKEKESILKIINEIDVKKRKEFMKTLVALNEIFSRNFSQLSTKGHVSLEVENKKNPFEEGAGVDILVKTGKGKYFDVASLSGGEQVIVALSLIFAIQEYRPYCFYILDEIDAALDKRNSERLGGLLKKYMKKGQYLIITHNDEIIGSATNLYGLSMHDGVSKIVSLKV